jgi:predicted RNA-binding protein (virulence factor B family)
MLEIGKINTLEIVKEVDFGLYLDGGQEGEILLPKKYTKAGMDVGDEVEVFIYLDSEDRIIATTLKPKAMVNEFACLECIEVTNIGAFLEWGLEKDLFVPFREQRAKMEAGKNYVVHLYLDDESNRIVASNKLDKFLNLFEHEYEEGQEVEIMICGKTDLGYKAIVQESHYGVLYFNETFKPLRLGQVRKAYIKKIRDDRKIDLTLEKIGYEKVEGFAEVLLSKLKETSLGYIPLNDKTAPEEIKRGLGVSKKTFKQAVGALYKQRLIEIKEDGIYLVR